jgi:hypothetical protein
MVQQQQTQQATLSMTLMTQMMTAGMLAAGLCAVAMARHQQQQRPVRLLRCCAAVRLLGILQGSWAT